MLRAIALTLLTGVLASCGEAGIVVQLVRLANDDPYPAVSTLRLEVEQEGELIHRSRSYELTGEPFELDAIHRQDGLTISVLGHDSSGRVVASGVGEPQGPDRGEGCCILVCFCSQARAADCTCGRDRCSGDCL